MPYLSAFRPHVRARLPFPRRSCPLPLLALALVGCGGTHSAPAQSPDASTLPPIDAGSTDGGTTDANGTDAGRTDASPPSEGGSKPTASNCSPIAIDSTTRVENSGADTYSWSDSQCTPRTAVMFRNDVTDGLGGAGGYLRRLTYSVAGQTRTCAGTGANGWNGFGYIVNHYGSTSYENLATTGKYSVVLAGKHHAIHQYTWVASPGGSVNVTVQWIFATGRDHPLYSITFDATPAGANVVNADSRAPYGDIAYDNNANGDVSGIGWGDSHKFTTTGNGPVTGTSPWDYTQANTVPYVVSWANASDSEMGLVATRTWQTKIEGGDYGGGMLMQLWGTTGTALLTNIPDWEWPYQLNQYDIPYGTNSHRVAWGETYGAVGQSSYTAFGKTLSGYPFDSYALYVVLGAHTTSAVESQMREIETIQTTTLTASRGTVSSQGPAGVARTDTVTYTPSGFDPIYGAWDGQAASNAATFVLNVATGSLVNPVFHVHGYTNAAPPSHVTFGGKPLAADADYFATVDSATSSLWLTVNRTASGSNTLTVDP